MRRRERSRGPEVTCGMDLSSFPPETQTISWLGIFAFLSRRLPQGCDDLSFVPALITLVPAWIFPIGICRSFPFAQPYVDLRVSREHLRCGKIHSQLCFINTGSVSGGKKRENNICGCYLAFSREIFIRNTFLLQSWHWLVSLCDSKSRPQKQRGWNGARI